MRGKMENLIEEKRRIRKKLLYTNDDYLFTRPIIARFLAVMELDRDLDRHGVKERRLNEETALESSGRRGGKRSKKARWVREGERRNGREKEKKRRQRGIERDGNLSLLRGRKWFDQRLHMSPWLHLRLPSSPSPALHMYSHVNGNIGGTRHASRTHFCPHHFLLFLLEERSFDKLAGSKRCRIGGKMDAKLPWEGLPRFLRRVVKIFHQVQIALATCHR